MRRFATVRMREPFSDFRPCLATIGRTRFKRESALRGAAYLCAMATLSRGEDQRMSESDRHRRVDRRIDRSSEPQTVRARFRGPATQKARIRPHIPYPKGRSYSYATRTRPCARKFHVS
jgi:hypothetical protein